jgi:putative N6-adenine-specific DNA methylase
MHGGGEDGDAARRSGAASAPPLEPLELVATCGRGLEGLLRAELVGLGARAPAAERGAVRFAGGVEQVWRANLRLRTANRVLVELGRWPARSGEALAAGARALVGSPRLPWDGLFHPDRTLAVHAVGAAAWARDLRWAALVVKDGLVDGQRDRWGRRSTVERRSPDLPLRLRLAEDEAALLLDSSGEPLDRRGYREVASAAPLRETLAAACVLASGWDGRGPVVDPMCGSGTLLVEAAWIAAGVAPGSLRAGWVFERFPGFDAGAFARLRGESPSPRDAGAEFPRLVGNDRSAEALRAARRNLERAGLGAQAGLRHGEATDLEPPPGPGLVVVNPPYGERSAADAGQWRALGDLLKRRFRGWRAVVLAGGAGLGKEIGLRPRLRLPVLNGPLEARILVFDLY